MIAYQLFYRKYGIRMAQQLISAPAFDIQDLDLPLKSIYHFVTYDGVEYGPPNDDYIFRNIKKPILVGHVTDNGDNLGNPRKQLVNDNALIRDYHNNHRRMRLLRNIASASKDPSTLVVYNYCLINKTYKYIRSFFTEYYKWHNTFSAVINNINEIAKECDHNHFLMTSVPKLLPSLQQIDLASKLEVNQNILKVFNSESSYLLLELWKWLGDNRQNSIFSKIDDSKIHLINIVYLESGKWVLLNLGHLNSFRKADSKENAFALKSNSELDHVQIQKRLLRLNMAVMELRTVTAKQDNSASTDDNNKVSVITGNAQVTDTEIITDEDDEDDINDTQTTVTDNAPVDELNDVVSIDDSVSQMLEEEDKLTEEELKAYQQKEDDKLDADLSFLNEISINKENKDQVKSNIGYRELMDEEERSLEDSVMDICNKLADDGLLTAGEYRRYKTQASSYKDIMSADGKTKLSEFIKINPKDLLITDAKTMPDSKGVIDKTMLKSSLLDFDSRYIENILQKDIANTVMSVQKAGIAVTDYRVEVVDDVLGGYEMHTVKLSPVEGAQSVIRFKVPVINRDGTYQSNNVKYTLRKQRGDVPIRKTAHNRVALTSYYGKTFINRSKKKASDYSYWLQCTIMEKGLNKDDSSITDILPANVFDGLLTLPRQYSSTSMSFRGFKSRGYDLVFDREYVTKHYPEQILKQFETDGSVVFGVNADSSYVVMDNNGAVYLTEGDNLKLFGSYESFLNIPENEAPVDYVEVIVFGKEIPIGVLLGYKLGLSHLIDLLKVEYRRVPAGTRLNLQPNEYTIQFSDETLIFLKEDKMAALILSSFNQYAKSTKLFSVHSFDKRGVYLNLLDSAQLGVRYLREIDLLYNMFIDPITRDLLIEMKEPVTFQGLLFRSCELLCTDNFPNELDPKYMRIKGYERISGAIYSELIQSIRTHNGKLGKSNSKIEMNPYAVWKRISEDPSKGQVSEINPIKALKEMEAVTFAGTGGRNKRSMTSPTRSYHKNDLGTISESTVDSSDVGINVFTSADPQFSSLRGMSKPYDFKTTGATALLSTSALLANGSDKDDQTGPL